MAATPLDSTPPKRLEGLVITTIFHTVVLIVFLSVSVSNNTKPPVREAEILFGFNDLVTFPPPPIKIINTAEPEDNKTELPSQASAPEVAHNAVSSQMVSSSNKGDVERNRPDTVSHKINPQALFQSAPIITADNIPTSGALIHNDEAIFRGANDAEALNTSGGSQNSNSDSSNSASFNLSGRSVIGEMPQPSYEVNLQGTVVVDITVDQNGNVVNARAISRGSTVSNATLWKAAEEAAKRTKFTRTADVLVQYGTITYIFRLN